MDMFVQQRAAKLPGVMVPIPLYPSLYSALIAEFGQLAQVRAECVVGTSFPLYPVNSSLVFLFHYI